MGPCKRCGTTTGTFHDSWPEICAECRRAHQRTYYASNQAKYVDSVRRYQHANPASVKAARAVRVAVRNGVLDPTPCFTCGAEKTEAHHASYSPDMWLAVLWLCRSCHRQVHQEAA
jgi:hypothetical protein